MILFSINYPPESIAAPVFSNDKTSAAGLPVNPPTPEGPALRLFGLCSRTQPREVLRPGLDRLKLGKIFYELPFVLLSLGQEEREHLLPVEVELLPLPLLHRHVLPLAGPEQPGELRPELHPVRVVLMVRIAEAFPVAEVELDPLNPARDDVRCLQAAPALQVVPPVELAAEAVPAADAE